MGIFDDVTCECDLPNGLVHSEGTFQTKSLYRIMARFTITKQGRLVYHCTRLVRDPNPPEGLFSLVPIDKEDIDMEYHGDILLSGVRKKQYFDYVARFTHGTLEWIRPMEELSEDAQALVRVRNLED